MATGAHVGINQPAIMTQHAGRAAANEWPGKQHQVQTCHGGCIHQPLCAVNSTSARYTQHATVHNAGWHGFVILETQVQLGDVGAHLGTPASPFQQQCAPSEETKTRTSEDEHAVSMVMLAPSASEHVSTSENRNPVDPCRTFRFME